MSVYQRNQERLDAKKRGRESIETMTRYYEKILPYLAYMDEQDERVFAGGRSARSARNAQKRGIERLFKLEADAYQEGYFTPDELKEFADAYGMTPAEMRNHMWADMIDEHYGRLDDGASVSDIKVDSENRRDLRDNFIYQLWSEQLVHHPRPIRTYAVFATGIALQAAVKLVTEQRTRTLHTLHYEGVFPDRERLLIYKSDLAYDPNDRLIYFKMAGEVPGLLELAETLLLNYADFVRAEQSLDTSDESMVPSPLPDDPGVSSLDNRYELPDYIRIEAAIQAYQAEEGSVRVIAEKYNLGRDRLFNILKTRGVLRPSGGDRRKG